MSCRDRLPAASGSRRLPGTAIGPPASRAEGEIMQEYVTRVERLPDGSLRTTLFRGGRRVHQEPVRTLRHGKRRAHDLLCSAVDTEWDDDRSAGSVVPCPGRPVAGSS